MEFFFTSITSGSLGIHAEKIYLPIQEVLETRLGEKDYGTGMLDWFLAFVILAPQTPGRGASERVLWKKKSNELDMRLNVDFEAFKRGNEAERRNLLVACMRRSLELMEGKKNT